jgi:deoxyadenosine/deoxycytidine kinase
MTGTLGAVGTVAQAEANNAMQVAANEAMRKAAACRIPIACASARDDSMQPQAGRPSSAIHVVSVHRRFEGPIGAGKTSLAERLATRLDATRHPRGARESLSRGFLRRTPGAALQAQLFYLLNRHRQQLSLRQGDLFAQSTVSDYLFDKDKIFAYLNLDDNELFIYQRLYDLLASDVPAPDLVIYLQAPTDVLVRRLRDRSRDLSGNSLDPDPAYLREVNEAYQHFFFHYTATPLLVVETSQLDLTGSDDALDDLIKQIKGMGRGTQYYVPRT